MRFFRQVVLHNWGFPVLLALAISFSLWAAYTAEPFAEITYFVPIAFVNVPAGLDVAGVPAGIRVRVRGRAGLLSRLNASEVSIDADLSDAQAGDRAGGSEARAGGGPVWSYGRARQSA